MGNELGLDAVLRVLRLEGSRAVVAQGWGECPGEPPVGWPDPAVVQDAAEKACLSDEVAAACVEGCRWIAATPAARRYLWHLDRRLFERSAATVEEAKSFPTLVHLGYPATLAGAVLCLARVPRLEARHRDRGIAAAVTRRTLADLELWIRSYRARRGVWGFDHLGFLWRHLTDRLFQLGRLQYELRTFSVDYHLLRGPGGETVVLAGEGMRFRADGQHADADGGAGGGAIRVARLQADAAAGWIGERMDPRGYASAQVASFPAAVWTRTFGLGSPVVAIHIPAGGEEPGNGPMTEEACEESLSKAGPFLARHYPEHGAAAYSCTSWLLDPQLEAWLGPGSNIVRFQRRFYLLPVPGAGPQQHFERVFGEDTRPPRDRAEAEDLKRTPAARSTMGRILLEHMSRGGVWRMGMGLIPSQGGTRWHPM